MHRIATSFRHNIECDFYVVFYVVFGCNLFVKTGASETGIGVHCECERDGNTLNLRSHRWCTSCIDAGGNGSRFLEDNFFCV
jgi:hypothetical protein